MQQRQLLCSFVIKRLWLEPNSGAVPRAAHAAAHHPAARLSIARSVLPAELAPLLAVALAPPTAHSSVALCSVSERRRILSRDCYDANK